jgi:cytochrome P450
VSISESIVPDRIATWSSWQAIRMALKGDALSAFPPAAFEKDAVVHRLFGRRQFILSRPEAIRHVLVDNQANYVRPPATVRVLRPIFGRGLFLASGREWQQQRKSVAPAFAPRAIRKLAQDVAAGAGALVAELRATGERPVDLVPVLQLYALRIIGSAMFSLDLGGYAAEIRGLIGGYGSRLGHPSLLDLLLPLHVTTPRDLARRRFRRRWQHLVARLLEERRQRGGDDLFAAMAAALDGGANDERIADQVATIIVAGHETTAAALFWALQLLASAPVEQQRIAAEAESLDLSPAGAAEALPRLVHTRAAIDETLRLYPPAFVIVRQALEDDEAGGIPVPAGSLVLIAPWVLHRHLRLWRAPERFDPSRFLPDAAPPPRFAYLPFGIGPRICVGQQFALTVTVLTVASLVKAFEIGLAEPRPARPVGITSTQPGEAPDFVLRPREPPQSA